VNERPLCAARRARADTRANNQNLSLSTGRGLGRCEMVHMHILYGLSLYCIRIGAAQSAVRERETPIIFQTGRPNSHRDRTHTRPRAKRCRAHTSPSPPPSPSASPASPSASPARSERSRFNACAYRHAAPQPLQCVLAPWGATHRALPPRQLLRPLSPRG